MAQTVVYTINGSCSDAVTALCAHVGADVALHQRRDHDAALTAVNPDRTVPTLERDDLVLTETAAILNHIARDYAAELLGRTAVDRARNDELLSYLATSVYNAFLMRFRPDRSADDDTAKAAIKAKSEQSIPAVLDALSARLKGRKCATGDHLTTADFLLLVMLNWANSVDPVLLRDRAVLSAHYERLRKMPFYERAFGVPA